MAGAYDYFSMDEARSAIGAQQIASTSSNTAVSGVTGQPISGTQRNAKQEAEALALGYSKEYIASRGGINSQGYWNDTPLSGQLSAAEYKSVTLPNGTIDTQAMANILQKKQIDEKVASGMSLAEATNSVSAQYGTYGVPSVGASGATGAAGASGMTAGKMDAIAAITALLSSYGIGDLSSAITDAVVKGYSADTIQLVMQDPNGTDPLAVAFQKRFPANKARAAAGKSVLSAAEYLQAERTYTQVLQSYGVSSMAKPATLNKFIENDVSAAEVSDRVALAVNRVQNADINTKKALAEYYPMLNQADIVGAVLDPAEGLPALQRKIQIGEIGGAALAQGLKTNEGKINIAMGASALADLGVTQEQARTGFQQVAEVTPRAEFLSSISQGADYKQLQAEQEAFQGLASAKRARQELTATEQARFSGQSGMSKASLTSQKSGLI